MALVPRYCLFFSFRLPQVRACMYLYMLVHTRTDRQTGISWCVRDCVCENGHGGLCQHSGLPVWAQLLHLVHARIRRRVQRCLESNIFSASLCLYLPLSISLMPPPPIQDSLQFVGGGAFLKSKQPPTAANSTAAVLC
ncbi:hypothetical protein V8C34DRAFT_235386 [Trichoderma compactum]